MKQIYGKKSGIEPLCVFDKRENLTPAEQKYYDEYWAEDERQRAEEFRRMREGNKNEFTK